MTTQSQNPINKYQVIQTLFHLNNDIKIFQVSSFSRIYALKQVNIANNKSREKIEIEIKILKKLKSHLDERRRKNGEDGNEYIVEFFEEFETSVDLSDPTQEEEGAFRDIVLEWIEGNND
jgi:serine/threonine protein kinase